MRACKECEEKIERVIEDNVLETEFHSLFIDKVEAVVGQVELDLGNGVPQIMQCVVEPEHNKYTLYVTDFVSEGGENHRLVHKLNNAKDNDVLEVRISSNGGAITEGIQFYNSFKKKFKDKVTTIIDSHAYSMGAVMFCFGNKRVAPEHVSFMFHDWQGASWGNGGNITVQSEHSNKWIDRFFESVIIKNGFLTKSEFKSMKDGKEHWFTVDDLAIRGIATHIEVDGVELEVKDYLEFKKSKLSLNDFLSTITDKEEGQEELEKEETNA